MLNFLEKQWIISGDENQFRPIWSSYRGTEIDEERLHQSRFLHGLTGGNRLRLTTCMRSDAGLFNYYSSLIPGGARFQTPLPQVLEEARAMFHFEGPARHNLCISHRKRIKLNRELNIFHKPDEALLIKAKASPGQLVAAQSMWIWPGLEVLGCSQSSKKIRNNCLYTILSYSHDKIEIEKDGEQISLSHDHFGQWCRLSYARTYASIQGTEFEESLRLHDTGHPRFSRKHLFVALSRGKLKEHIHVA
jgi:hypothetical protein